MKPLSFYAQNAKERAKRETANYDKDTLIFLSSLFSWKHPEISTYQYEKICIVLIRPIDKGEKPETPPIKQIWLSTYVAYKENENWIYKANFEYIAKTIKALSETQQEGNYNVFMAFNTFKYDQQKSKYSRTQARAFRSQAIGVDLDFYKLDTYKDLTYEAAIAKIKADHKDIFKRYRPMVVKSGGGCQLYFLSDKPLLFYDTDSRDAAQDQEAVERFKTLSQYFNSLFLDAGADAKCKGDAARIFKIPGVLSLKYEAPIEVSLTTPGGRHSFRGIETPPRTQQLHRSPQKDVERQERSMHALEAVNDIFIDLNEQAQEYIIKRRIRDLNTLLIQKDYDIRNYRELFLFIYCIILKAATRERKQLLSILENVNERLREPLELVEIENIVYQVLSKSYKVTNEYIYDTLFNPLGADLTAMEGRYTPKVKKAAHRALQAKQRGGYKKVYSKTEKREYIAAHPELTNKELAAFLKCTERTIRDLKRAA